MVRKYTFWNEEMLDFIRRNYNKFTDEEMAESLGMTLISVKNARVRYKIKKDPKLTIKIRIRRLREGKVIHGMLGKHHTKKSKEKLRQRNKGQIPWNTGLTKEEYLKHCKKGKFWATGLTKETDERVKNLIEKALKTKRKNNSMPKGKNHFMYGKTKDNYEPARRNSERMKNGGAIKALLGNKLKPNKPEKQLNNLLQTNFPNLFEYTGDGKFIIEGFCPDFTCKNHKKIIEHYGKRWHNLPEVIEWDKRRLKTYSKYGYKTLIIWDYKLENSSQIINKIKNFIK